MPEQKATDWYRQWLAAGLVRKPAKQPVTKAPVAPPPGELPLEPGIHTVGTTQYEVVVNKDGSRSIRVLRKLSPRPAEEAGPSLFEAGGAIGQVFSGFGTIGRGLQEAAMPQPGERAPYPLEAPVEAVKGFLDPLRQRFLGTTFAPPETSAGRIGRLAGAFVPPFTELARPLEGGRAYTPEEAAVNLAMFGPMAPGMALRAGGAPLRTLAEAGAYKVGAGVKAGVPKVAAGARELATEQAGFAKIPKKAQSLNARKQAVEEALKASGAISPEENAWARAEYTRRMKPYKEEASEKLATLEESFRRGEKRGTYSKDADAITGLLGKQQERIRLELIEETLARRQQATKPAPGQVPLAKAMPETEGQLTHTLRLDATHVSDRQLGALRRLLGNQGYEYEEAAGVFNLVGSQDKLNTLSPQLRQFRGIIEGSVMLPESAARAQQAARPLPSRGAVQRRVEAGVRAADLAEGKPAPGQAPLAEAAAPAGAPELIDKVLERQGFPPAMAARLGRLLEPPPSSITPELASQIQRMRQGAAAPAARPAVPAVTPPGTLPEQVAGYKAVRPAAPAPAPSGLEALRQAKTPIELAAASKGATAEERAAFMGERFPGQAADPELAGVRKRLGELDEIAQVASENALQAEKEADILKKQLERLSGAEAEAFERRWRTAEMLAAIRRANADAAQMEAQQVLKIAYPARAPKPSPQAVRPAGAAWESGAPRPFAFDPNSTVNQGRFRLLAPETIQEGTHFTRQSSTPGISYIMGKDTTGKSVTQAIRFNKNKFTEEGARAWWEANKQRLPFAGEVRPAPPPVAAKGVSTPAPIEAQPQAAGVPPPAGRGKTPPPKKPRPPRPAGTTPPEPPEDPVAKLTRIIKAAKPAREETEALKTQELQRRAAVAASQLKRFKGEEAFIRGKGALRGELPRATFEPPIEQVTKEDIFNLQERIRTYDRWIYRPFTKINAEDALQDLLAGAIPQRGELALLEEVFGSDLIKTILSKRSLGAKVWEGFLQVWNMPRALKASFDDSFGLRQGALMAVGHPRKWWAAKVAAWKSLPKGGYEALRDSVELDSLYDRALRAKLDITFPSVAKGAAAAEEPYIGAEFASKIPVIGKGVSVSEQLFTGQANKLRFDLFKNYLQQWGKETTPEMEREIAKAINILTGRAPLGKFEQAAPILSGLLFSPRYAVSRFQAPFLLASKDPMVRKMAARTVMSFVGTVTSLVSAGALFGVWRTSLDPRNSDFMKIIIGNTRIDPWGGFQQVAVFLSRLARGEKKFPSGGGRPISREELLGEFARSKAHPSVGTSWDTLEGKDFSGEKVTIATILKNLLMPITPEDLLDAFEEYGATGGLLAIPAAEGVGVQTFKSETPQEKRMRQFQERLQNPAERIEKRRQQLQDRLQRQAVPAGTR